MPMVLTSRDIRYGACWQSARRTAAARSGGKRRRLVLHVYDLRLPLAPRLLHHPRLDHVEHVGVAVVVVADVLLIELRQRLVGVADVLHVPLGHHLVAVGLIVGHSIRITLSRMRDLRIVRLRQQVIRELQRVLRPGDFRRVQAAVDVDDRLCLPSPAPAPALRSVLPARQATRDLAVAIDLLEVRRASKSARVLGASLGRRARFDHRHVSLAASSSLKYSMVWS